VTSERPGGAGSFDIYVSTRTGNGSYGPPQLVPGINWQGYDVAAVVTSDGLTIYWGSNRGTGDPIQGEDVWRATRSTTSAAFGNVAEVPELNSAFNEHPKWISPDGCTLYLTSERPGGQGGRDIWEARRPM